ncbi:MAG: DUF3343 domain-containing protein [Ruminococcus sp.]|nr:DUF3343 domain-containing protein [Candidatus Apopatosoma intestinale]
MSRRIITVSSPTYATKGARILSKSGIPARVTHLHASQTLRGCTSGVEIRPPDEGRALDTLSAAGIPVTGVVILG